MRRRKGVYSGVMPHWFVQSQEKLREDDGESMKRYVFAKEGKKSGRRRRKEAMVNVLGSWSAV